MPKFDLCKIIISKFLFTNHLTKTNAYETT